jgi:hypothetical protein
MHVCCLQFALTIFLKARGEFDRGRQHVDNLLLCEAESGIASDYTLVLFSLAMDLARCLSATFLTALEVSVKLRAVSGCTECLK